MHLPMSKMASVTAPNKIYEENLFHDAVKQKMPLYSESTSMQRNYRTSTVERSRRLFKQNVIKYLDHRESCLLHSNMMRGNKSHLFDCVRFYFDSFVLISSTGSIL